MRAEQFPDFDLYEELEVSPRASEEVIQAAYRTLAQTFSARMVRLNVAREFLSDPLKRADYDRQRLGAQAEAQPKQEPPPANQKASSEPSKTQDDHEAAIADDTSVIEAYSDDTNPQMRQLVARALVNRGYRHEQQGGSDAAIADYTSVIETYSDDTDPEMRLLVATALVNRGIRHEQQGDTDAAIADYTSVIEAYSDDTDPEIRLQVAEALYNRGVRHEQQGGSDAAIADYTSVIETYSDDTDPEMRLLVAAARGGRRRVRVRTSI